MSLRLYKYAKGLRKENIIRIRLSNKMLNEIKTVAKKKGCSMSDIIRKAIIFYMASKLDVI